MTLYKSEQEQIPEIYPRRFSYLFGESGLASRSVTFQQKPP